MLLIRNGLIHTMSDAGSFRGDILTDGDRILQVGQQIDTETLPEVQVIDAQGLQVCPGLIDAHVHLAQNSYDLDKDADALCTEALASGITTLAMWPEGDDGCIVRHGQTAAKTWEAIHRVRPNQLTDEQLGAVMAQVTADGGRIACEVCGEKTLQRLLRLQKDTNAKLVLIRLEGCEKLLDEVISVKCEVILGACALHGNGGYAMAARLAEAGITLAMTSDYPATRLHHLPLCTGLCVRAGMSHHAALRTITLDAAKLLRVDDMCGSIEAGKRADLVLFDGDPLMLATALVMTICGGTVTREN